ncbi:MAG TPA: ABC transporter ATP-binding protein [Euzebyales bacterium]|nr:ABC transporter ATP-binding protein [Euzebyales bacterium]
MRLLRTDGVTRRFGDLAAVDAVDLAVDLAVDAREVVGLLGANGAGKTTLVKVILGLLGPSAGTVELLGGPPSRDARTRIGYLPQNLGLYTDLTVTQQLRFTGRVYGYRPELTRVPGDAGGPIGSLPLGARRLAAFAAATGHGPELLLLDEPTSGVDPLGRARLWERVREQADAGRGVLISTHHLSEAEQCDRLIIMAAGRVVATGPPDQIVAGRHTVAVRTDHWQDAFTTLDDAALGVALDGRRLRVIDAPAERVAALLASAGIPAEAHDVPATLEEVFVELARRPAA